MVFAFYYLLLTANTMISSLYLIAWENKRTIMWRSDSVTSQHHLDEETYLAVLAGISGAIHLFFSFLYLGGELRLISLHESCVRVVFYQMQDSLLHACE